MFTRFLRVVLAVLLCLFASLALAQTPQYRSSSTLNGSGTLTFPAGSVSSDWLVLSVISMGTVTTPAGWSQKATYPWSDGYYSYVYARQKGSHTNVAVATSLGAAVMVAYQNASGIGAVGTYVRATGSTLPLNGITPQHASSLVLGLINDRDTTQPTAPAGFTGRVGFSSTYFANHMSERAFGSTAPTGTQTWTQSAAQPAAGVLVELLPLTAPTIANAFSPATIASGGTATLTFTLTNPNAVSLTNASFTDTLTNLSVAGTTIGGTCGGVTNSPALTVGATSLNLTIASLASGSCTVTVQVTSNVVGSQTNTTSGVTSTQTPIAGAPSNTATLTVVATPAPPVISQAFQPAWIASGGSSTLTFALTSPMGLALTNVNFTDTFSNITVASSTLGGTCAGTTNSPSLTVGATGLNLTIPSLPAAGCTVTVQLTSSTLGSNANTTSGATSSESITTGAPATTIYLTVNAGDEGFLYVHADHLGTPRAITRPSDNATVWRWDNTDPFGANLPNENPSGLGNFKNNNRFPGQYSDEETGTYYNRFRDYDPATGRYVQSDPIGLRGGINTFGYVGGLPLTGIDPLGLDTYLIFTTEQDPRKREQYPNPWGKSAEYARKKILETCNCKDSDIKRFDVDRVDQVSANMRDFNDIRKVIFITHSGFNGLYVGASARSNSNITNQPGPNNVPPSGLPWDNMLPDGDIEIWGCNSTTIAQQIANASQRRAMGFSNSINFGPDGAPFVRLLRRGGPQWFNPQ